MNQDEPAIQINDLTKSFGRKRLLERLSLTVPGGASDVGAGKRYHAFRTALIGAWDRHLWARKNLKLRPHQIACRTSRRNAPGKGEPL